MYTATRSLENDLCIGILYHLYVCCLRDNLQPSVCILLNIHRLKHSRENLYMKGKRDVRRRLGNASRCTFNVEGLSETTREIDSMHQEPNLPNWPLSPPSLAVFSSSWRFCSGCRIKLTSLWPHNLIFNHEAPLCRGKVERILFTYCAFLALHRWNTIKFVNIISTILSPRLYGLYSNK